LGETNWQDQWTVGTRFLYDRAPSGPSGDRVLNLARVPNLLLGALLVGLVGLWSYRLWGRGGCLLGMALAAFDPNLVAHASLATTDLGLAFFAFLTLYLLWEYTVRRSPSWWRLVAVGVALGLALATKYSAVSLLGILAVIVGAEMLSGRPLRLPARPGRAARKRRVLPMLAEAGAAMGILLGLAFLAFWSTYFFHSLAACWHGLKFLMNHQREGHTAFLLGQFSDAGWWYYFPVAMLVKTPVPTLILMVVSIVLWRGGKPLGLRGAFYLVVPVMLVLAAATMARINIGIRHVLLVYPFLYVAAARVATVRIGRSWLVPWLTGGLAALGAVSSLRTAPYDLSYFNELAGGPTGGLYWLSDSNLEWGQGLRALRAYMQRERIPMVILAYWGCPPPEDYGIRYQYAPGCVSPWPRPRDVLPAGTGRELLAVSGMILQGYFENKEVYRWLLARKPAAIVAGVIYVYDVTGDADAHLALGKVYSETWPKEMAIPEFQKVLDLEPNSAEAHLGLGRALWGRGQFDQATIAHFQRAVELRPDCTEAHNYLGVALARRGQIDEAIAQLQRALELKPDYAEAHNNLGAALAGRGELDEAAAHYRKALELNPDYAEAHNNLGFALAGRGQIEEAMAHFQSALELKPDYAEAHNNLGSTLAERGRIDEARAHFRKALVLARQQNNAALAEELQARLRAR